MLVNYNCIKNEILVIYSWRKKNSSLKWIVFAIILLHVSRKWALWSYVVLQIINSTEQLVFFSVHGHHKKERVIFKVVKELNLIKDTENL